MSWRFFCWYSRAPVCSINNHTGSEVIICRPSAVVLNWAKVRDSGGVNYCNSTDFNGGMTTYIRFLAHCLWWQLFCWLIHSLALRSPKYFFSRWSSAMPELCWDPSQNWKWDGIPYCRIFTVSLGWELERRSSPVALCLGFLKTYFILCSKSWSIY